MFFRPIYVLASLFGAKLNAVSAESPPSIISSSPIPDHFTNSNSIVLQVRVIDVDGPIKNVKFVLFDQVGNKLTAEDGVKQDVDDPDGAELWLSPDLPLPTDGQYKWRAIVIDSQKNKVSSNLSTFNNLSDGISSVIKLIRSEIEELVLGRPELKPKFLRMGFHDCVGGCDGCIDLMNPDNNGLDIPIDAIGSIVTKWANNEELQDLVASSISRADIWALATLVGADTATPADRPFEIEFALSHVGRVDCTNADEFGVGGDHRSLPSPDLTTDELLQFFEDEFDFDVDETVCIMGAHSIGRGHRANSGFDGKDGWVFNPNQLNSGYYDMIAGGSVDPDNYWDLVHAPAWDQVFVNNRQRLDIDSRYQWIHAKDIGVNDTRADQTLFMTNADIALVRNLTDYMTNDENGVPGKVDACAFRCPGTARLIGCTESKGLPLCPIASTLGKVVEYKFNQDLFLIDFEAVIEKMILTGYNNGIDLQEVM